jgi:hypothetical protein
MILRDPSREKVSRMPGRWDWDEDDWLHPDEIPEKIIPDNNIILGSPT